VDIEQKLDQLADLQAQADVIRMRFNDLRDGVMTPEIKQALADIDAEERTTLEAVSEGINKLTADVKDAVILAGASVKGKYLQAVWAKGRVSWDTKALDGYAAGHPEIAHFRKEGEPSVSIRNVK
jgi:Mn-containing catalase